MPMIDIHVHLLPRYDDGPEDLEKAVEMVQVAAADGVEAMVATPHNVNWSPAHARRRAEVEADVAALQAEVARRGLGVRIYPGVEVYIAPDLVAQLRRGQAFPLCGGRYLLVEFPFGSTPTYGEQVLFELQVQGLVPIVAHPERHAGVVEDPNLLYRWVGRGILAQVNAGSLLGQFGRRVEEVARLLLEHDLVHFLGSDGHGPRHRPPVLGEAAARAADLVGEERAACLVQHWPAAVLADAPLDVPQPRPVKRRRWFW